MSATRQVSRFIGQQWNAPGRMMAASIIARALAIAAPLPFLYAAFRVEVVAFWLLVITFQSFVGAFSGILPMVAIQMIAYARTGSTALGGRMEDHAQGRGGEPNWALIAQVNGAVERLFGIVAAIWTVFAASVGTLIVWRSMMATEIVPEAAVVWAIFIVGSAVRLLAQPYATFGQGFGEVAAIRRSEAVAWLLGATAAVAILAIAPNLPLAMAAVQAPILLNFLQYRRLARRIGWAASGRLSGNPVAHEIWPRVWRGAIGQIAGMLTVYGGGFVYAQASTGAPTAAYLLGLNVLGIVGQVSSAPVFAAVPALATRFAQGLRDEMNALAQRAIGRSMRAFALLVLIAPVAIFAANRVLPAPLSFPDPPLWLAMSLGAMIVRHGADHLQFYTTTNDIRSHVINSAFLVLSLGPFLVLPASNAMLLVLVQGLAAGLVYLPYTRGLTARYLGYSLRNELPDFLLPAGAMLSVLAIWTLAAHGL